MINPSLHLPDSLTKVISGKFLLLDTSFFIDAIHHKQAFDGFAQLCKQNNSTLVTIQPVLIEFLRGTPSKMAMSRRVSLVYEYIGELTIPVPPRIFQDFVIALVEKYGKAGAKVSLTDYLLAAITQQHRHDLLLVTKNSLDFPAHLFNLESYFVLQNSVSHTVQTYCIFSFREN